MIDNPDVNAAVTFVCSYLSLFGSLFIIISYVVARTKSTPKTAFLILHLAISDFFWFLAASILATVWLANDNSCPDELCYLIAPVINFTRMTSLIWTVAISFNVYMSVRKRKWFWKSQESDWEAYRKFYFGIAFLFAAPNTIITIVYQHTRDSHESNGCGPEYEPVGNWAIVLFTELLPIIIGFICNLFVFRKMRRRMSKPAFPQSVRKRRKRVMYNYITICILCWIPTILLYILEICGFHLPVLEIFARTSLYISGFLNFLVFGMNDPHLKRAIEVIFYRFGCYSCCYSDLEEGYRPANVISKDSKSFVSVVDSHYPHSLKSSDVEKMVMFQEESINKNADLPKDRNSIYRNRILSKEQKAELYVERPDLVPKFKTKRAYPKEHATHKETKRSSSNESKPRKKRVSLDSSNPEQSDIIDIEQPLLQDYDSNNDLDQQQQLPAHQIIASNGKYVGTPHPHAQQNNNKKKKTTKKKKSLDGDRELNSARLKKIPIPAVPQPPQETIPSQQSMSYQSDASSQSSLTRSHDFSLLSDLSQHGLLSPGNSMQGTQATRAINDLVNVVNGVQPPSILHPNQSKVSFNEERGETTINALHDQTNNRFTQGVVTDSLLLHRQPDEENEGEEEEEEEEVEGEEEEVDTGEEVEEENEDDDEEANRKPTGNQRRREADDDEEEEEQQKSRSSQSSSNQGDSSSSSSEDEHDAEDEDFLNSPL